MPTTDLSAEQVASRLRQIGLLMCDARKTMEDLVTSVRWVTDAVSAMTAVSQGRSAGAEQVKLEVMRLGEETQRSEALLGEADAVAELLQGCMQSLDVAAAAFEGATAGGGNGTRDEF